LSNRQCCHAMLYHLHLRQSIGKFETMKLGVLALTIAIGAD
jgi:hypothetical protein